MMIKRALISVADKKNLDWFAKGLSELGIEIIATGGTASLLKEHLIPHAKVEDITHFPEILDGRVKTLHPSIFAGILYLRKSYEQRNQLQEFGIGPIDMVVVNFYPFEKIAKKKPPLEKMLDLIDIGGPSLVRASAKNFQDVIVIVDPDDYEWVLSILKKNEDIDLSKRKELAVKAFKTTCLYDFNIYSFFSSEKEDFPEEIFFHAEKAMKLRYGENPHQRGVLYLEEESPLKEMKIHGGKELSYNNFLDIDSVYTMISSFHEPFAVIIKHTNPCGAGIGKNINEAFRKAFETDPKSAFGGIIGVNREVNDELVQEISKHYFEVIVAPSYSEKALSILTKKKNLRIIEMKLGFKDDKDFKRVCGGYLYQDKDNAEIKREDLKIVSKRAPTEEEIEDMIFSWRIVKFVKSNAIVIGKKGQTIGIGAGQMSRVDSVELAIKKANIPIQGSALASDAFFPFPDSIEILGKAGITSIIQPGGSIRDKEVIEKADELGIAMVFTGIRHFRH
ncbi:MAG: bifunctional phosphoribosylaminoimidazolecarboxamide formyltransferase/IMP cyclohydrolase [Candidatus Aminicenantia bacterium]